MIRLVSGGADDAIRSLLQAADLPTADLEHGAASSVRFWVLRDGARVIGAVGLERFGSAGLLRSLVVDRSRRGEGLGIALVRTLERESAAAGIDQLVLLTQTARPFFERLGYVVIDRPSAPEAIRASTEFRALCPASATCMSRNLDPPSPAARSTSAAAENPHG
jgi:amino-acid N-acetyltransferase